jgi:hypothetical protein
VRRRRERALAPDATLFHRAEERREIENLLACQRDSVHCAADAAEVADQLRLLACKVAGKSGGVDAARGMAT